MTIKRKMKKQTANKLLCLLLAVLLLAGQVLPALALNQEGGTITIATAGGPEGAGCPLYPGQLVPGKDGGAD